MKTTFLKSLLVAAGLFVGASAWADDYYNVIRYSQDFEDETTFTTGWTVASGSAAEQKNIGTTNVIHFNQGGGSGNRNNYFTCATASDFFASSTDYSFEFDYGHAVSNQNESTTTVYCGDDVLFSIKTPSYGTSTVYDAADTELCAIENDGYAKACPTKLNHFLLTSDASGTFLTITNASGTEVLTSHQLSDGLVNITKIDNWLGRAVSHMAFDNLLLKEHSDVEAVSSPSISITGVSGVSRIVTITSGVSSAGNEVTTYYTIDGTDPTSASTEYTSPVTIDADCTVKAVTISSSDNASGITSIEVTTGEVVLNVPTWKKTDYAEGVSTVTLSADQSSVFLKPVADIYYRIDEGEDLLYSDAITVNDGETLYYYATASGYTNSAEGSVVAMAPCDEDELFIESYSSGDNKTISVNSDEVVTTINTTDYYYMYYGDESTRLSERLVTGSTGISNWLLRPNGLYGGNTQQYAITGVKKGDYVTITIAAGTESPIPSTGDGERDDWNSTNSEIKFRVTSTMGNFRFKYGRYAYIKTIRVQGAPVTSVSATISNTGFRTFSSTFDLDLANLPEGVKAYFVEAKNIKDNKVTLTEVTEAVEAGTGLLLKGEAGVSYNIPIAESAYPLHDNILVGCPTAVVLDKSTANYASLYVLAGTEKASFYNLKSYLEADESNAVSIPAGKAYLDTSSLETARLEIVFPGEATGIANVNVNDNENGYYNLNGQRVAQPVKGLYIVNGKKVIK